MRALLRSTAAIAFLIAALSPFPAGAAPGDLDPSFGDDGRVTSGVGRSARAVAIQTDGAIVVVGDNSGGDFVLARYNNDGNLDASFGNGGVVTTDIAVFDEAYAVAIQADGKILAAGGTSPGGYCCQFALARYNADGSLDPSFDGDGKLTTAFGGIAQAYGLAIQSDGKIVAAGTASPNPLSADIALARYNSDGSLDPDFGSGGRVATDFGGSSDRASGIAIQGDGRIVVSGSGGTSNDFVLSRYEPDGNLDGTFDADGRVITDFGGYDGANGLAIQADGKIVAAGGGGSRFAAARYNTDGSLDTDFDGDGMVVTQFYGENIESAAGLAVQSDGKVIVVGTVYSDYDPSFGLVRYNSDGSLDTGFGSGGKVTTDFGDPSDVGTLCPESRKDCSEDVAQDIAIQPDGKIIAVGGAGACTPTCMFALARYSIEGPSELTYTVNTRDDGDDGACDADHCSLREAINAANALPGADTIAFDIPGGPPFTISPGSGLPSIEDPVTIDGTTQPGYAGTPIVEISGESVSGDPGGLGIFGGGSTVKGLVINRFPGNGIDVGGDGGSVIEGNFIGTDTTGMLDLGNGGFGIAVHSDGNSIVGNLISGNEGDGLGIFGYGSDANTVQGNLIGTDADGLGPLPNVGQGVWIGGGASDTAIGGDDVEARNVISGNKSGGISINGPGTGNVVQGNYIGIDALGTASLPNTSFGVTIAGSAGNTVESNVISGNTGGGVGVAGEGSTGNMVLGNRIGTSMDGSAALGNPVGVWLGGGAVDTRIGGTSDADRNIISGNSGDGVSINGPAAGTVVWGNYIGTDASGTAPLANGSNGVVLVNGTHDNHIGGSGPGAGNLISGNAGTGIAISDGGTTENLVQGNLIGTDATGTSTTGAGGPPLVDFTVTTEPETCPTYEAGTDNGGFVSQSNDPLAPWSGASVHFLGTGGCGAAKTHGSASLIYRYRLDFEEDTPLTSIAVTGAAFNGPDSILRVLDASENVLGAVNTSGGNSFLTNYITLQGVEGRTFYVEEFDTSGGWRFRQSIVVDGPPPMGNRGSGVSICCGASGNTVGGDSDDTRNIISGNSGQGVVISDPGTDQNTIQGNFIGTDVTGTITLGNLQHGVLISGGPAENLIGGAEPRTGNLVSGNMIGVNISDGHRNQVMGNRIGTDVSGTVPQGNRDFGVVIDGGSTGNVIGGTDPSGRNVISGNASNGIWISGQGTSGNRIQGNYIGTDVTGTSTTGAGGPPLVDFTVTTEPETCPTYGAGTDIDGFVSESSDPLGPWSGQSVHFRGQDPEEPHDPDACHATETLDGIPLVYRYKLSFGVVTPLTSIAVSGAAFNGGMLRVLDEGMNVLGTTGTFGGNSFRTNSLQLDHVEGTVFYIDEFDFSASWRFRQSIVVNGPPPMGNRGSGVVICCGASGNTVGGSSDGARNIISGNAADGIGIYDAGTTGNAVLGNYIGTDLSGTVDLGNGANGVALVGGASENLVGGTGGEARNIISGNTWNGVAIFNPGTTGNRVQGNYIGTDVAGGAPLGNSAPGIGIGDQASGNLIGGADAGAGNLISGNISDGIAIFNTGTTANIIQGNLVGTDAGGGGQVSNQGAGVWIGDGASNTVIGGTAEGARNVISGNNADGISINDAVTTGIVVQGNYVGTDLHGNAPLPNGGNGVILVNGTHHNTIGGPDEGAGNLISANTGGGVGIADSPDNAVERNVIYGNVFSGVWIWGAGSTGNTVRGNLIGTDPEGTEGLGNGGGVWIGGEAAGNMIGGTEPGDGNTIAFNATQGVAAAADAGVGNAILANATHDNGELGIDLGEDGVTLNDKRDPDSGPNDLQNFPVLSPPIMSHSSLKVAGVLWSTPNTSVRIEFFEAMTCDPSGYGEGDRYLGFMNVRTGPAGVAAFVYRMTPGFEPRGFMTATATDSSGSTSEFSQCSGPVRHVGGGR